MDPLDMFKNHLLISGLFFKVAHFSLDMNVYRVGVNVFKSLPARFIYLDTYKNEIRQLLKFYI